MKSRGVHEAGFNPTPTLSWTAFPSRLFWLYFEIKTCLVVKSVEKSSAVWRETTPRCGFHFIMKPQPSSSELHTPAHWGWPRLVYGCYGDWSRTWWKNLPDGATVKEGHLLSNNKNGSAPESNYFSWATGFIRTRIHETQIYYRPYIKKRKASEAHTLR